MRKIIHAFCYLALIFTVCAQVYAADYDAFRKYPYLIHAGYKDTECGGEKKPSMMILWHTSKDNVAFISFGQKDASGNTLKDISGNIIYENEIKAQGQNCCEREGKGTGCTCDTPISGFLFKYPKDCLTPDSVTYYQVKLPGDPQHPFKASFKAAPDDALKNLIFYGLGDTRANSQGDATNYVGVVTQMLKDISENRILRNTLCIHDGDFVYQGMNDEENNEGDYWDREFFNPDPKNGWNQGAVQFLGHVPVMGAVGNHEGYYNYGRKKGTDYKNFGQRFKAYYPYPFYNAEKPNHFYYSFDYGPVHFIMVDTNNRNDPEHKICEDYDKKKSKCRVAWKYDQPENEESSYNAQFASLAAKPSDSSPNGQYEWLKTEIETSTKLWNIVVLHNPLFTASDLRDRFSNADGGSVTIRDGLHNLLLVKDASGNAKVKLVIQGHDHYYTRSEKDGITYLTLGTGGANSGGKATSYDKSYKPPSISHPEVKAAYDNNCGSGGDLPCFHFVRFEISGSSMNVTVRYASRKPGDTGDIKTGDIETFTISLGK